MEDIKKLFEKAEADGVITSDEIKQINDALAADGILDYGERQLLEQMVRKIRSGELKEVR
jgi:uncharacterized membrane protein YebE (DUF533 family)